MELERLTYRVTAHCFEGTSKVLLIKKTMTLDELTDFLRPLEAGHLEKKVIPMPETNSHLTHYLLERKPLKFVNITVMRDLKKNG